MVKMESNIPTSHMMLNRGGGGSMSHGPPNAYMNPNGGVHPNGGVPIMGSNGQMIKMEPNGYGNGMNANGTMSHHLPHPHHGHPHMNHMYPPPSGTPGATPTPPPVSVTAPPTTATGGRRGRKKQTQNQGL